MVGFYVAATVVTLLQYLRLRQKKLLPLLVLFTLLAVAHARGEWDTWGRRAHFGAGAAGLVLLVMLSPRRPAPHA